MWSISPSTRSCRYVRGIVQQWPQVQCANCLRPNRAPGATTHHLSTAMSSKQVDPAPQSSAYSPLSSHDSDWKELRDCTSDRLSRALYGCEGFSSKGFLERQGSRSTTLAERNWWQRVSSMHEAPVQATAVSWHRVSVTKRLPGMYLVKVQWKEKKGERNIWKTKQKTKKPTTVLADSQNRNSL